MSARRGAETPTGHASSVLFICAVQRVATSHMWLFTLELIKIKYKFLKISSSHSLATFQVLHNLTLATISESTASQKDLWDSTTPGIFKFLLLQFLDSAVLLPQVAPLVLQAQEKINCYYKLYR